jgi:transcriptional regulator with XRE-family HTH domain
MGVSSGLPEVSLPGRISLLRRCRTTVDLYSWRLRKQRSWSQDELATAAGLNLRTVQRIETQGTASLQSLKAIASALQTNLLDLKYVAESRMRKLEYKTVVLPFRMGLFKQGLPDIQTALNKEGQQGWRFTQMVLPSTEWGKSDSMVAILERALDDAS